MLFFAPFAVALTKATLVELITTVAVTTTVANAANDAYQKTKESARSSDDDKHRDRN